MRGDIYQPIGVLKTAKRQQYPFVRENGDLLIQIEEDHPRIFIQSFYYLQHIPNSLKSLYLREGAYERLKHAVLLLPENYSLILYDGFRPIQVQQYLFTHFAKRIKLQYPYFTEQEVLNETHKYVAFPNKGQEFNTPHLTGGAIDLTLGDLNGRALNLGTAFDEISEKSETRYFEQHPQENTEACIHRRLLYNCMTMVGFSNYSEEWWHFDFNNISWARREDSQVAGYGAIEAKIQDNQVKGYRYL
ncbi:M15 family metallopeptidase [Lysinibacillus sp. NPDC097287]|uniref:M15 family metallopeptidase n=1 Tax=Lysinibacillus sp. NPDC097287 TaxID=3364144 RepID=UPI0038045FCC